MAIDWEKTGKELTGQGFAELPQVLTPDQCDDLTGLYGNPDLFRSRIDMKRYRFGRGRVRAGYRGCGRLRIAGV